MWFSALMTLFVFNSLGNTFIFIQVDEQPTMIRNLGFNCQVPRSYNNNDDVHPLRRKLSRAHPSAFLSIVLSWARWLTKLLVPRAAAAQLPWCRAARREAGNCRHLLVVLLWILNARLLLLTPTLHFPCSCSSIVVCSCVVVAVADYTFATNCTR